MTRLALLLLLTPAAIAQSQGTSSFYDFNGDPLQASGPGVYAPGDIWATFAHSYFDTDGVAPYQGGLLMSYSNGLIYHIDEATGVELNSFPVADANDAWLGYDSSRDLVITTNAGTDRVKGYTLGNPVPVFDIAAPTSGPVGIAWDPTRDEYIYCDWETDQVVVLNAGTLATARTFNLPSLARMVGVAYDCVDDVYIVGDRDLRNHSTVDPVTGAIGISWPAAGVGGSNPRGAATSSLDAGLWTGDWQFNDMFELEPGHGPTNGCGGFGTGYCTATANSTGSAAGISAAGSNSVAANDLTLSSSPVPNQPGLFYYGPNQVLLPFGDGFRCVGGTVVRLNPPAPGSGNTATRVVDVMLQGFMPGQAVNFQYWFRDPLAGGTGFNLSSGIEIVFAP